MPSVSRQQQKLMHGIASGSIKGGKGKPTKAVAQAFVSADHKRGPTQLPQRVGGAAKPPGNYQANSNQIPQRIAGAITNNKPKESVY